MKIKELILICTLAGIGVTGLAQVKDEQKVIPEGKWLLQQESVRAEKGCNHAEGIHTEEVNIETVDVMIYTEIKVKQDTLFFISANDTLQTAYVYTKKTGICFVSPNFPLSNGGNVYGNNLYVQQRIDNHSFDSTQPMFISFIYEYKEKE